MTEREAKMIAAYIPTPRDPDLPEDEYYILDNYGKCQRVYISDINPDRYETKYGVRYSGSGRKFTNGWEYGKTNLWELYDNKPDCRDQTHMGYNRWEDLRKLQEVEHE